MSSYRFHLDKALAAWRRTLEHDGALTADDLDELEQHLRDQVAGLIADGLTEKAALDRALREMGDSATASYEYRKVFWGKRRRRREIRSEVATRFSLLANYIKVAYRDLMRWKGYGVMNVAGLAVGLACCLVVVIFVREDLSYDRFHEHADRIVRIVTTTEISGNEVPTVAPGLLGPALVANLPGVVDQVRVRCDDDPVVVTRGTERFSEAGLCYADSTLFNVFDFGLSEGNSRTALTRPNALVISRDLSRKYFGTGDPVGQVLEINGAITEVTGVFEEPEGRSHLQFGLLASLSTLAALDPTIDTWANGGANPYVVLAPGYDVEELRAHLDDHLDAYMGFFAAGSKAHVQRLREIYHSDWPSHAAELRGNDRYVYLFSTVALLILLIACINYVNLATAQGLRRSREVGVRKAIGAEQRQLVGQFLSESMLLSLVAFVIAYVLAWFLLPQFGDLIGRDLDRFLLLDPTLLLAFLGFSLVVGLVAGGYPAFYLSGFDPVAVFQRNARGGGTSGWLRKGLLTVQFTASIGLVAGTVVLWNQLDYVRNQQLGFDKDHVVLLTPEEGLKNRYDALKRELLAVSGVIGVTTAPMPGHTHVVMSSHRVEGYDHEAHGVPWVATFDVDHDFLDLMNVGLLAGRDFDPTLAADASGTVLVNEAAVRRFEWGSPEEALGKRVMKPQGRGDTFQWNTYRVEGVVEDFQSWTMKESLKPIFIYLTTSEVKNFGKVLAKIQPDDVPGTLARIEEVWADFAPDRAFDYAFLDQEVESFYRADLRQGRLLRVFSVLSVLVACLGLFGLAALTAEQRKKEIGIRKVMGATIPNILGLLCREYLVLMGIAFAVAVPITYAIMNRWLQEFAYSDGIGWEVPVYVGAGALLIALATVSYQSLKAALADPVESLRYE